MASIESTRELGAERAPDYPSLAPDGEVEQVRNLGRALWLGLVVVSHCHCCKSSEGKACRFVDKGLKGGVSKSNQAKGVWNTDSTESRLMSPEVANDKVCADAILDSRRGTSALKSLYVDSNVGA